MSYWLWIWIVLVVLVILSIILFLFLPKSSPVMNRDDVLLTKKKNKQTTMIRKTDLLTGELCDTHGNSFVVSNSSGVTVFRRKANKFIEEEHRGYVRHVTLGNKLLRVLDDKPHVISIGDSQVIVMDSPVLALGSHNNSYGVLIQGEFIYYIDCACTGSRKLNEKFRVKLETSESHNQVLITADMIFVVSAGVVNRFSKTGRQKKRYPGRFIATDGREEYVSTSRGIVVYENEKEVSVIQKEDEENFGINLFSSGPQEILISSLSSDNINKKVHFFSAGHEQSFETKCKKDDLFIASGANAELIILRRTHDSGVVLVVFHDR